MFTPIAIAFAAFTVRMVRLDLRPMHTDEAVHAYKLGEIPDGGGYQYNPGEYHGPTLNYFTLVVTRLAGVDHYTELNEVILRMVPVFFSAVLILLLIGLATGLGRLAVICAALGMAVSPAMFFYSRYYIQEILLVCFTSGLIVAGYRYVKNPRLAWAISAGVFAGLMHATKETCIIAFGAMVAALILVRLSDSKPLVQRGRVNKKTLVHALAAFGAAVLISVLFFSSFFTHAQGILDSLRTYTVYFQRAGTSVHQHPWYYYLQLLSFNKPGQGLFWSEGFIIILAVIGAVGSFRAGTNEKTDKRLLRFITFYTALMICIYSAISYKTPWCMLGFLHGLILLAGYGVVCLARSVTTLWPKRVLILVMAAATSHLAWQSWQENFKYEADPVNPYVYAHTSRDIYPIIERLEELADFHPQGHHMPIQVVCPEDDYWPLPWYLRSFTNVRFLSEIDPSLPPAPVILAKPQAQQSVLNYLYNLQPPGKRNLYLPLFDREMEMRPRVPLDGYLLKELADDFHQSQL
ncbi:MAG: TIGR03663 family protein [Planctomycetes bacterium]|nr:TIGR03663 family protein [Planctomycetota bacterium]